MTPHRKIRSSPADKAGLSRPVQGGLYVAALVLLPLPVIGGSDGFREFLDFGTGVLSLVSLTASVAWALVATDRLLLTPRQRLLAQAVHRGTAVASLGFLLLHGTVKVSLGHVELIGALIPFGLGVSGSAGLIGFGSLAGLLMVAVASTGALRSTLAGRGAIAARWRPLHMLAYPAWCAALIHGLYAGRPAASWVVVLYGLSLAAVAAAVSVRLLPTRVQRELAERVTNLLGPVPGGAVAAPFGAVRRGPRRARRNLSSAPLPGAYGAAEAPRPHPYEQESRFEPPRRADADRAAPEVPPLPRDRPRRPTGAGAGLSAGYRAVSLGGGTGLGGAGSGGAAAGPGRGEAPYAERVPMTEELPTVTEEPSVRSGHWPTPSPPPPAPRAYAPPPAAPEPPSAAPSPMPSPYESPEPPSSYDTAPPQSPFGTAPPPPAYDPAPPPSSYGTSTGPTPGPARPPAGEPWTAPAGERP
ncbi:ferric reductase-like transmembrane domain-containing protein [Streptomyces thermolilacinus]|uniref:ferric reductase-like transmembrane domain-containing protein n=1 Tax=Streptomyces thermolilacinus TaxID=285540 RepID=UPI0003C7454E|nr:ferric reductase-like transmembrane domain-containing protein [Streptomyces thermolilacinus]